MILVRSTSSHSLYTITDFLMYKFFEMKAVEGYGEKMGNAYSYDCRSWYLGSGNISYSIL